MESPDNSTPTLPTELDSAFATYSLDDWKNAAQAGLPENTELQSLRQTTLDGLTIEVLYDSRPASQAPVESPHPKPSQRSLASNGLGSKTPTQWDNRLSKDARSSDSIKTNQEILQGLAGGISSLELYVDADTDMATILDGVRLDIAPVSLRAGPQFAAATSSLQALISDCGLKPSELVSFYNADPVADLLRKGLSISALDEALAVLAPFTIDTLDRQPRAKTLLVDVALHHNAGASVVQELTAAIATATLYLDCLTDSGLDAAMACQQIQFQVACDADILMNVVKLRSLRTIWQHVVLQFIQQKEGSHAFSAAGTRVIAETSQRHLSRDEPWINHLRNVSACTAAAIGNTDTIIVHPHDRVDGVLLTNEPVTAQRVARNLPIILEEESGLRTVHDPMGGAYAIETLSQQVCDLVWQFLVDLKDSRGWIAQLASGQWQDALSATHAKRVARLQAEESIKVGVNRYRTAPVPGLQRETGLQQTGSVIQADALASQSAGAENLTKTRLLAVRESQLFESDPSGAAAQ